jgi:uncharacterized protein (TIRG00374 family)
MYRWIAPLVIALLGAYYLWTATDLSVLALLQWENVAAIMLLTLVDTLFSVMGVYTLLRGSGSRPSLGTTFLIVTASLAANYATPVKLGIPLRVYLYRQKLGIPVSKGSALIAIETILGLLLPVIIALVGIATIFTAVEYRIPLIALVLLIAIAITVIIVEPRKLLGWTRRLPFRSKMERFIQAISEFRFGLVSTHWASLLVTSALLILAYVNAAVRLLFISRGLGADASILHLFYAQRIAFVAGSLSMIPMGLGVRDASLTLLLIGMGIPRETCILVSIVERMFSTGWRLLLGFISISILGVRLSDTPLESPQDDSPEDTAAPEPA